MCILVIHTFVVGNEKHVVALKGLELNKIIVLASHK